MGKNIYVTPGNLTKTGAWVGAIVAAAFLVFGVTFGYLMLQDMPSDESSERVLTLMFFVIFTLGCLAILFMTLRTAMGKGTPREDALINLESDDSDRGPNED